jgi:hypothetical protein
MSPAARGLSGTTSSGAGKFRSIILAQQGSQQRLDERE